MSPSASMTERVSTSPSIRRILRYVEWTVLIVILVILLVTPSLTSWNWLPTWMIFPFLGLVTAMSFGMPLDQSAWQRRSYVFIEFLLVFACQLAGFNFDILLYLLIAKSCFLLSRRDVAITVLGIGCFWLPFQIMLFPKNIEFIQQLNKPQDINKLVFSSVINYTGSYITASVFVLLFSYAIVAEYKSRQRAETLAQEVEILAATLERTRIAQEIHDSLGHTLTTLDIQLEVAQKMRDRDPQVSLQAVDTAKQLASQSLQDVRHALQTLRSSTVNLNEAVMALVEQTRQHNSFTIQAQLDLPPLPLQASHQLYCVIKESLMNVHKHAAANHVVLNSQTTAEEIYLSFSDDGVGFNTSLPYSGFGLRGMQERIESLGGKIQIKSSPNQGTEITMILPRSSLSAESPCCSMNWLAGIAQRADCASAKKNISSILMIMAGITNYWL
ncbi:sensor histidine kinase [Alkalinema pantanalense CENA528]|uniref:sensor histidine kinase n=1 Tax=Alkalinema pantanalense TaxID=1620705 RepID=UPI003D6EC64F